MVNNWITILSFTYPHEAHLAKTKLESEGFEVMIKDELTVQVDNFYSNAIGGVKLQVSENDYDRALQVLKDSGYIIDAPQNDHKLLLRIAEIEYQSIENDEVSERTIEPFALYSTQENWLLVAWCRLRDDYRTFRLDRILRLEIVTDTFEPHKDTLQEYFEKCRNKFLQPLT